MSYCRDRSASVILVAPPMHSVTFWPVISIWTPPGCVDNALKFTPPGGQVGVRSFADDDSQGIEVTDTGPGIPLHHREDVLRRFYRTEDSRHTPGSGLGLALVAGVAGLHEMAVHISDADPGCRIALIGARRQRG